MNTHRPFLHSHRSIHRFFNTFLNPFFTIEPVAYIYDAVSASVGAVVAHQQSQQKPGTQLNFPADIEGDAIANSMAVSNFTVMGVTGSVQFETGIGGIPDYGWVSDPPLYSLWYVLYDTPTALYAFDLQDIPILVLPFLYLPPPSPLC